MSAMADRIPHLSESELVNLWNNAQRLVKAGTDKQKLAASSLVPPLRAEMALRSEAKKQEKAARLVGRRRAKADAVPAD